MKNTGFSKILILWNRFRRAISNNLTPVLAVAAFCVFGIFINGSTCVVRVITGLPCPGCGLTRASISLLHFDFPGAFHYHPLVYLIIPLFIITAVLLLTRKTTIWKLAPLFIVVGIVMSIVYVIRLYLFFPDIEPMIYDSNSVFARLYKFLLQILY